MVILKNFYLLAIVLLSSIMIILNLNSSSFINKAFQEHNFTLLNMLGQTTGEQPLEYYQGRVEDETVGPVTNVLSFVILILICFRLASHWSFFKFSSLIFLFLTISKFNILFYPPYGDTIGGPFAEALWLKDNYFNYVGLFHQPGYLEGGQKVYVFTIYPTYIAILYTLIHNVKVFIVVNHLLVFAMAGVVVAASREILKKSLNSLPATLGSLAILAMPLFQSQTEAINMEMPQLFFAMLSIWALVRNDFFKASLWAIFAVSVKGLGVSVCLTVFLVAIYFFLFDQEYKFNIKVLIAGVMALIFGAFGWGCKYLVNDAHVSQGMVKPFVGWASLKTMYAPAIFFISAGLLVMYVVWESAQKRKIDQRLLKPQCIILLMSLMILLLFLNFKAVSPRYKLGMEPFLMLSILFSLMNFRLLRQWAQPLLVIVIVIISFGAFGKYYPSLGTNYHVLSERNLGYRNNVKLDQNVISFLEKNFSAFTIGAPFIYAQMLNLPELGYVKEPLNVVQYGFPARYGTIKSFEGLDKMDIMKTIWVGLPADHQMMGTISYPIHQQDKVIKEFVRGDNKATLFVGGLSIEFRLRMIQKIFMQRQLQTH